MFNPITAIRRLIDRWSAPPKVYIRSYNVRKQLVEYTSVDGSTAVVEYRGRARDYGPWGVKLTDVEEIVVATINKDWIAINNFLLNRNQIRSIRKISTEDCWVDEESFEPYDKFRYNENEVREVS